MLKIYTDGSFRKPNIGAYGYVVVDNDKVIDKFVKTELNTTINIMELTAIKYALLYNKSSDYNVEILSDSQYSIMALTVWVWGWRRNNWTTLNGQPVKNKTLLEEILTLANNRHIVYTWVKAHNGDKYNEICDTLVQEATKSLKSDIPKYAQKNNAHGFDITESDTDLKNKSDLLRKQLMSNNYRSY